MNETIEEWRITVKVLERMRGIDGLNPELSIWMDCIINSLKNAIELYKDE
jgi:hypothetical protein